MSLRRFTLRRLWLLPVQIFITVTVVFFVIHALPGSPVFSRLGLLQTPELAAKLTDQLGLDEPLGQQYKDFLGDLVKGDLGLSIATSKSVSEDLRDVFPATLELILAGLVVGLLVGGFLGVAGGLRARGPIGVISSGYRSIAGSIPEFWLGLLLIYIFFVVAEVSPGPIGQLSPDVQPPERITGMLVLDSLLQGNWPALKSAVGHLVLPALVLGLSAGGAIARLTRAVVADAASSDYVQYARMVGLSRTKIARYVVRASAAPVITLVGVLFVASLGGVVPIEVVFSWGGLGQYAVQAVQVSDYPAIQGVVLLTTTVALVVYFFVDLLNAWLDPRTLEAPPRERWWRKRPWSQRHRPADVIYGNTAD